MPQGVEVDVLHASCFQGALEHINNLLMSLAEEQIKSAFAQSEKEVQDLHTRISQGMRESNAAANRWVSKRGLHW